VSTFAAPPPPPVPTNPSPAEALALLREIETRFQNLQSLRYQVTRSSRKARQTQEERWIFSFAAPDRLRIDYQSPQERLVIITAQEMWEYVPSARKALHTDLKPLSAAEKTRRMASVMARVSIDGLHPGNLEPLTANVVSVTPLPGPPPVWRIEGTQPRFQLTLDPARKTLIASEIHDAREQLTLRTEAGDWIEAMPGHWFPRQIRAVYPFESDFVVSQIRLEEIELNRPLDEALFSFTPPAGVEIVVPPRR